MDLKERELVVVCQVFAHRFLVQLLLFVDFLLRCAGDALYCCCIPFLLIFFTASLFELVCRKAVCCQS